MYVVLRVVAMTLLVAGGATLLLRAHTRTGVWNSVGLSGQTIHALAPGHTHPRLAFAATENGVYQREGSTWRRILQSAAIWDLVLQSDDRELVAGGDDGYVHVSWDRGAQWYGHRVTSQGVYAVTVDPANGGRIVAGAGGGLYLSQDGGRHWQLRLGLVHSAGTAFAWLPGNSRVLFAGTVASAVNGERSVFVSRDAGLTWRPFGRGLADGAGIMSLVASSQRVYAGTMGHAVWMAPLHNGIWRSAASGMPLDGDHGAGMVEVPGWPGTLFVGTLGQGVYRTTNGGREWTNVSAGLPRTNETTIVLSLAYSPHNHLLYAGTIDGVYTLNQP